MPREEFGNISVYCVRGLTDREVKELGEEYVQGSGGRPLKGHALVPASVFEAHKLALVLDGIPHARHANVIGWETDAKNRLAAKALAEASSLKPYPL